MVGALSGTCDVWMKQTKWNKDALAAMGLSHVVVIQRQRA